MKIFPDTSHDTLSSLHPRRSVCPLRPEVVLAVSQPLLPPLPLALLPAQRPFSGRTVQSVRPAFLARVVWGQRAQGDGWGGSRARELSALLVERKGLPAPCCQHSGKVCAAAVGPQCPPPLAVWSQPRAPRPTLRTGPRSGVRQRPRTPFVGVGTSREQQQAQTASPWFAPSWPTALVSVAATGALLLARPRHAVTHWPQPRPGQRRPRSHELSGPFQLL